MSSVAKNVPNGVRIVAQGTCRQLAQGTISAAIPRCSASSLGRHMPILHKRERGTIQPDGADIPPRRRGCAPCRSLNRRRHPAPFIISNCETIICHARKTYCAAVNGLDVTTVTVEVNLVPGIMYRLMGLGDTAVREGRDRIASALQFNGYKFPHADITVNLAPADLRKEGSQLDLPPRHCHTGGQRKPRERLPAPLYARGRAESRRHPAAHQGRTAHRHRARAEV